MEKVQKKMKKGERDLNPLFWSYSFAIIQTNYRNCFQKKKKKKGNSVHTGNGAVAQYVMTVSRNFEKVASESAMYFWGLVNHIQPKHGKSQSNLLIGNLFFLNFLQSIYFQKQLNAFHIIWSLPYECIKPVSSTAILLKHMWSQWNWTYSIAM